MRLSRVSVWPANLFYGWRIVALGSWTQAMASGIFQYGFAVFFLPVSRDFGTTRAQTALVFSLDRAEGALGGPLAGFLVDRLGPKPVLFGGAIVTGLGYVLLPWSRDFLTFLLLYIGIISIGYNGGFMHPVMTMVNSWFNRRRGLAFAINQCAFSLGGTIFAPVLALMVERFGWRMSSFLCGIAIWLLVLPVIRFLVASPEQMGLTPDGEPRPAAGGNPVVARGHDFLVKEALSTRAFWQLAVATTLRLAVINTLSVHYIPIFVWKGASETTAAFTLGTLAFLSMPTRILLGYLGDRFPKNLLATCGLLVGILGLLVLQFSTAAWQLWIYVAVFAFMEGVAPLNWAMVGDFFGRARFATLRGAMGLMYTWGAVIGPVLAGVAYDGTGGYSLVIWVMTGLLSAGAVAFAMLRPPRAPAGK